MTIECIVACTGADGDPTFYPVKIKCTDDEYSCGDHYEMARDAAEEEGYEHPMVVFDYNDAPGWLLEHFKGYFK